MDLIKSLCEENGLGASDQSPWFEACTVEQASKRIFDLKEMKVRDAQLRKANEHVNGFDKITYAMVYKFVWKACSEMPLATKPSKREFSERVSGEYLLFKQCLADCKQVIEEGGSQ
jgi:hypothetical protein